MEECRLCDEAPSSGFIERRSGVDRRRKRVGVLRRVFIPGHREALRRREDRRRVHLFDVYNPKIFYAVTIILLLSVIDAFLTLWLLGEGATELNPVMAYFLLFGPVIFMIAKYALTSASVVIVVVLNYVCIQHIRFPLGRLLNYFAGCFATVVAWELFLIFRSLP